MKKRFFLVLLYLVASACISAAAPTEEAKPRVVMVDVWANSEVNSYEAYRALDGNPKTIWHTEFGAKNPPHPHELRIDLGQVWMIEGFTYRARQDHDNGTVDGFECFVGGPDNPQGNLITKGRFGRREPAKEVRFAQPVAGRFFRLRATSEVNGQPWTSVAELEIHVPGVVFRAKSPTWLAFTHPDGRPLDEVELEFALLERDLRRKAYFAAVQAETFNPHALIWSSDRDPVDIALRRLQALLEDYRQTWGLELSWGWEKWRRLAEEGARIPVEDRDARLGLFRQISRLRRQVAFANPLLDFDRLLILKRHLARYDHMCDQYYGVNAEPGGGLYIIHNPFSDNPREENLLANSVVEQGRLAGQKLEGGAFLSPDLSYDATRIAFAYVECRGDRAHRFHTDPSQGHWHEGWCYHIFTVRTDGTELKQLTDGTWNDFDPVWLPNGRIAFISERRGGYLRCGRVCPTYTLFDMAADGSSKRALSIHETNEWNPTVTHDGRILYTRWDYVDRHGVTAHMPWVTTIDGRDSRAVHGNFTPRQFRPDMELDCQPIPGSVKFVATAAPHHGQAFGSIVIVDPRRHDDDRMNPVRRVTPEIGFPESQGGALAYGTPWPLSENYYLVAYDPRAIDGEGIRPRGFEGEPYFRGDYSIYLVDAFGNKVLIYRDPTISCQNPIPLKPRPVPHQVPELIPPPITSQEYVAPLPRGTSPALARVAVINVYDSLHPWPPQTKIAALRVVQILPMTVPSGQPPHEIGLRLPEAQDSVMLARYVLGTVPVEPDGSAYFEVPANKEIFFQALDERGLAVQSMRSATYLKPGEFLVCKGCHDPRHHAPSFSLRLPTALTRAPSSLSPEADEANPFSYARLVQPILDRRCVPCHMENQGAINLGREPLQGKWFASYVNLASKYGFWSYRHSYRTIPGQFGARASKLRQILQGDHYGLKLEQEEFRRLMLWLDLCSIFYGVYEAEGGQAQLRGDIAYPTLE
ncbi:MAG: discoidin domain-containing protein [Thermoguttaceae bacterium]|nr:discoidin domain-containing protein [Thermoguttaceae bacterium]MDW8077893.1 discoidin domain-containing protein [Thermoguttaceae bacterium]